LACIDSSIRICERLQIPFGVALNQVNRANVLVDMKKPAEALQVLNAVSKSPFGSIPDFLPEICEISHKAHQMLGNTALAYSFLNRFTMLRDSMDKEGARLLVFEWEERILREKKERELAILNKELQVSNQRQRILLLFGGMLLLLLFAAGRIFFLHAQKQRLRARLAEEEKENLRLTLEMKERELTTQSMHLQSIGGFAEHVLGKLSSLKTNMEGEKAEELARIIRDFETGMPEELWDDFRVRFEKINEDFYQKLLQICPDLSPVEIKIASFLRLNLSSKEISRLTNRSAGTISNTRSALRKKLNLDDEDNLVAFLMSL
jgi:DNA-binding CsgD family transcriptional regulator